MPDRRRVLEDVRAELGLLAVYLFGSRADDGMTVLEGDEVDAAGSDLDVGIVFASGTVPVELLGRLQVRFEEVFAPLRVDLVPLQRLDALFQFNAIDGHRVATGDAVAADYFELEVMRRAAEQLPIERRLEEEEFGVSTA
jgi:predicted nucleotidyltransferase